MKMILRFFSRLLKINPWIGILLAYGIVIPSLYEILDDITIIRIEYFFLIIGILLLINFIKKLFDNIINMPDEYDYND
jgi:hypothetical protein